MNTPPVDALLALPPWLAALAPAWPLALLAALAAPPLRGAVLPLAGWAALPALLIAMAAPPAVLPLPGLLLGASVQLDAAGRWLLATVALLWLAGGWLAADWLCSARRAAPFLTAMAGALWLPLAGDLPSALAASVLAAYPLYGLLGGARGGRVLLVSVVIADLLILEALLLLAKGAAGIDFASLRAALTQVHGRDVVLALLLIGFGAKAGLMSLHYWLAPALAEAPARTLGPVVALTLVAGLLPWLRLLPIGEVQWPAAAALLPWLALAGCVWALAAGLLQATARGFIAYMLSALAAWWLGLFGSLLGLDAPASVMATTDLLPAALALSGLGVGALLLAAGAADRYGRLVGWGLALLAALIIALAVLGAVLPAAGSDMDHRAHVGSLLCVGLLLGAAVTAATRKAEQSRRNPEHWAGAVLAAGACVMAMLALLSLAETSPPAGAWSVDGVIVGSAALVGGFVVGMVAGPVLARMPRVPAGDLLVVIEHVAGGIGSAWIRLGAAAGHWRDRLYAAAERAHRRLGRQRAVEDAESWLRRWSTATLLLLLAGAAAALLARQG